jgi:C-terminal processing protease CtpA/Prc
MIFRSQWIGGLFALSIALSSGAANAQSEQITTGLTTEQKIYGLSLFWKEVSYNFAHWESAGDLNWDEAYREYIPQVLEAQNDFEYYQVMQRFCALLKDGHTNVWMPPGLFKEHRDRLPFIMTAVNRRAIVRNVDVLLADQIPIGTEILDIDGKPVRSMIEEDVIPLISTSAPHMYWETAIRSLSSVGAGILFGPKGSTAELRIQKPNGQIETIDVRRNHYEKQVEWLVPIPKVPLSEFRMLDDGVAYMALNDFSPSEIVDEFRARLPDLDAAKGIIIDLRKNGGGNSNNSSAIVGHFTTVPFKGASWRTPVNDGVYRAWGKASENHDFLKKYQDYYYGHVYRSVEADEHQPSDGIKLQAPTLVLIGRKTASAAEDFLIMADGIEHITTMGEPTHGSTGQPLSLKLPGGGSARISAKRDFYPDGREFIGLGVQPDVLVGATVEDIRAGRDIVLERALNHLGQSEVPE